MEPPAINPAPAESDVPNSGGKRRRTFIILGGILLAGLLLGGGLWIKAKIYITTDNAFVEAPTYLVSARINSQVKAIYVRDNQTVKAGDLLAELDDADYEVAVRKAEALLAQAANQTGGEFRQIDTAAAAVRQAEISRDQAKIDLQRGTALISKGIVSKEQYERLDTNLRLAEARVIQAQEAEKQAREQAGSFTSGLGRDAARIAQRRAELDEVKLGLSRTHLTAPANGFITRKTAEVGNNVRVGQALMSVVDLSASWITANLKETQITHIQPGQKVTIRCDALPGEIFHGEVESIMAGTGAAFSLLPPENATGNYVKVVQRIPVRIRLSTHNLNDKTIRVGMSVVPEIDTGRSVFDVLADLSPWR